MSLQLYHLDERTRRLMLEEMKYDIDRNQLQISPVLSGQGQRDYPNLLREAIESGNEESLADSLKAHRRIQRSAVRRKPKGGYAISTVAATAAETLAENEFNRYYLRALCRRAMEDGVSELVIYRARAVREPRPQSEALIETTIAPEPLLEDLRSHTGENTELGVPGGPNSGISVRLP